MSDVPATDRTLALTLAAVVDRACDRFSASWRSGNRPRIEDYLHEVEPSGRAILLRELLAAEIEKRSALGEQPIADDYRDRFPEHSAIVDALLAQATRARKVTELALDDRDITSHGAPGRFRITRSHARGGLGVVFLARDRELPREVALKEIQSPMADDPGCRARFVREAEITGALEHPGIVPVYSLGQYQDGRPYYAMRFIRGESLHQAISLFHSADTAGRDLGERTLAFRQLLRRFVDICNTIAYAHSRGVLHRDLKPDNVMLGAFGETLVVDWGLTRLSGQYLEPEDTGTRHEIHDANLTRTGFAMGTPAYMSPEQADGRLDAIGPQSDIYGLGATLYCLLTGRPPFVGGDVQAVLKRVHAGDFPLPSEVKPGVDRALAAICVRSMARVPEDRYESARSLADEVEHWLADEPVSAWREPFVRRVRRWARRHRTAVAAGFASLLVALAASLAIAAIQAYAAKRERELATKERVAKTLALGRLGQLEKANNMLGSIFKDLNPRSERKGRRPLELILGERLTQAAASLDGEAVGDPLTVAKLQDILGTSQASLGNSVEAIALLKQACQTREARLGANDPATIESRSNLAEAYYSAGQFAEALAIDQATLKARESILGLNHPHTLKSRAALASDYAADGRIDEALTTYEETLKAQEATLGANHADTLESRMNLATLYFEDGEVDRAIAMHEETLKRYDSIHGPDHPSALQTRTSLAEAYAVAGRTSEAVTMFEATIKVQESRLGFDHPESIASRVRLGKLYRRVDRTADGIATLQAALKTLESRYGADYPDSLRCSIELGRSLLDAKRTDEAIVLCEATLKRSKTRLGVDDQETLALQTLLAATYQAAGRTNEAIALLESTLKTQEAKFGFYRADTIDTHTALADLYSNTGRTAKAVEMYEKTLKFHESRLGPNHRGTLESRIELAEGYIADGRTADAIPILEAVLKVRESTLGAKHLETLECVSVLAEAYWSMGRMAEAIPLLESTLSSMEATTGLESPDTIPCRNNLASAYSVVGRYDDAIALYEVPFRDLEAKFGVVNTESLASRGRLITACSTYFRPYRAIALIKETLNLYDNMVGAGHPYSLTWRYTLGMNYLAIGQTAQAIDALEATVKGREQKLGPDDPETIAARGFLIAAYELSAQPTKIEPLARECLKQYRAHYGANDTRTAWSMAVLGYSLIQLERYSEAEAILRKCLAVREATERDYWTTFHTRSLLGEALLHRRQFDAAEPLIVSGYQGMKKLDAVFGPAQRAFYLGNAASRILQLYEAWGKPAIANDWRSRLGLLEIPVDVFTPTSAHPNKR